MIKVKVNLDVCTKCRKSYHSDWLGLDPPVGLISFMCPETLGGHVQMSKSYPPESCPKIFEHLVAAGLRR